MWRRVFCCLHARVLSQTGRTFVCAYVCVCMCKRECMDKPEHKWVTLKGAGELWGRGLPLRQRIHHLQVLFQCQSWEFPKGNSLGVSCVFPLALAQGLTATKESSFKEHLLILQNLVSESQSGRSIFCQWLCGFLFQKRASASVAGES